MEKYDSLCPHRIFDCEPYEHRHCTDCNAVLLAVGGGDDDGRGIDGYEDALNNSAKPCATCGNDSLRCKACADENAKCSHCRELEETPCAKCGEPVGSSFRDLGLRDNGDGTFSVLGPSKIVCGPCADCHNCEECRVGAA